MTQVLEVNLRVSMGEHFLYSLGELGWNETRWGALLALALMSILTYHLTKWSRGYHPFFFCTILHSNQNDAVILAIALPDVLKVLSVPRHH